MLLTFDCRIWLDSLDGLPFGPGQSNNYQCQAANVNKCGGLGVRIGSGGDCGRLERIHSLKENALFISTGCAGLALPNL